VKSSVAAAAAALTTVTEEQLTKQVKGIYTNNEDGKSLKVEHYYVIM